MRSDSRNLGLVVTVTGVLMLTVLGAAVGGSWQLEERSFDFLAPATPAEMPPPPPPPPAADAEPAPASASLPWGWLRVVVIALTVALAGLALWWLWTWLAPRRALRREPLHDLRAAPPAAAEPAVPVLQRGVAEAQRHLAVVSGPSDAVVAAWLALEDAATASGVRRSPWQTPTEFTVAVLDNTNADPDATAELLALYHRARFSSHPIEAADVDRAAACFGRLAASWQALTSTEAGTS